MTCWDDLQTFLAVLRTGSASRAAADLEVTVSTVTRRLARLEASLGKPLFVRTSGGMTATSAADALQPHAEAAEHAVLAGQTAVEALDSTPRGPVTVALPADMVQLVLLPTLAAFTDAYPDIQLDFVQGSGLADLMRREADIAVRVVRPTEGEELVVTRLRSEAYAVFGSRDYLAAHPSTDPADHRWITWGVELAHLPECRWLHDAVATPRIALRSNAATTIRLGAAAGVGLALLPKLFGHLTPTLAEVDLGIALPPPFHLWMVTHRALRHAPAVAAVWNHLEDRLRRVEGQDDLAALRPGLSAYGVVFDSTDNTANHNAS